MSNLRHLPAVDVLLSTTVAAHLVVRYGASGFRAIRSVLDAARTRL